MKDFQVFPGLAHTRITLLEAGGFKELLQVLCFIKMIGVLIHAGTHGKYSVR